MKKYSTTLLLISFIVIISMSFYFLNRLTKMEYMKDTLSTLNVDLQIKEEFYNFNFECNNMMSGKAISDILCIGRNNEESYLSKISQDNPILVYRYQSTCSSCKQDYTELDVMNELYSEMQDNVIILCWQHLYKDLLIYSTTNKIKIPIYVIPLDAFDWIAEKKDASYYFVLHPDMRISNIYVPNKDYPKLNKQYLEGIKRYLLE